MKPTHRQVARRRVRAGSSSQTQNEDDVCDREPPSAPNTCGAADDRSSWLDPSPISFECARHVGVPPAREAVEQVAVGAPVPYPATLSRPHRTTRV